ncbi:VOC family protein [Halovulum sp. GXIMD14793]
MLQAHLEHTNFTASDPLKTAAWMEEVFGWKIRWQGATLGGGYSVHVGTDIDYVAVYSPKEAPKPGASSYETVGGLNHIAVTVDDLDATERKVTAAGFEPHNHADYEPGRRFYFRDHDGVEFEVVQY